MAAKTQVQPLNVIIVGGVAGGMSCATRLRRNDETARITVVERGPYVSYANCGIPYALGGVIADEAKLHVQTPEKMRSWFGVDVRTGTELVSINRAEKKICVRPTPATAMGDEKQGGNQVEKGGKEEEMPYDKLVLALGAQAIVPPIKGVDAEHVFTLQTIPDLQAVQAYVREKKPRKAAIIGAGFIGLEAAENLKRLGLDVTIFEFLPHVFPLVDGDIAAVLHNEVERNGVNILVSTKVTEIVPPQQDHPGKVLAVRMKDESKAEVDADLVVLSVGVRPRIQIPLEAGLEKGRETGLKVNAQMQTSDPDIYAVGDMVETLSLTTGQPASLALAGPANRQGRMAADHIADKAVAYRGNLGTSVCKVFDKTVGLVGQSADALRRSGVTDFEYVTVHPPDHAGYYPGAAPLTLRIAFDVRDGTLLGAQAIGNKAVDKRIDVLATAMRAGMTITDLEHLELSYAPPYGSAKDAINMAAFAGSNILRGDSRIVHAEEFVSETTQTPKLNIQEYQLVDVRSAGEFANGHLRGARNIPVAELRDRQAELDPAKKTVVYCRVGYRGYLAYRILRQRGFADVANLDGGFKSVSEGGFEALEA